MSVHVDSNVLIDLLGARNAWTDWAGEVLGAHLDQGLVCSPIVWSETSAFFSTQERFERTLAALGVTLVHPAREALFEAARVHLDYRRRGGTRTGTLLDFLIGAQALGESARLITRDTARYRTYFPKLELITP